MDDDRLEQYIAQNEARWREANARIHGLSLVVLALGQALEHSTLIAQLRNVRVFAEKAGLDRATVQQIDEMIRDWVPKSRSDR